MPKWIPENKLSRKPNSKHQHHIDQHRLSLVISIWPAIRDSSGLCKQLQKLPRHLPLEHSTLQRASKIWGPQTQPDAVETSDPLPVEGMQDVQTVDQLRDRTPVPQDSDHLAIHSHSYPLSEAMDDGESDVMHERIAPSESARLHLLFFNAMEAAAGSVNKSFRTCYVCCTRWRDESPFPPCHYVLLGGGGSLRILY